MNLHPAWIVPFLMGCVMLPIEAANRITIAAPDQPEAVAVAAAPADPCAGADIPGGRLIPDTATISMMRWTPTETIAVRPGCQR